MVLIHTCFALQHPLQLCKCGYSSCPVAAKTPLESLPRRFSRMAVLSWSSKFAKYTPAIVLVLGKYSNKISTFVSQNTVAITLPADGCVWNFSGLVTQALPTDDF